MTEENCEESCPFFPALMRIDPPLALRSREAREETQRDEESPGSAGSICWSCTMLKRNDPLAPEQKKSPSSVA